MHNSGHVQRAPTRPHREHADVVSKAVFAAHAFGTADQDGSHGKTPCCKTLLPWTVCESKLREMAAIHPHKSTVSPKVKPSPLKMVHRPVQELSWVRTTLRQQLDEDKPTDRLGLPGVEMSVVGADLGTSSRLRPSELNADPSLVAMVEFEKEELVVSEDQDVQTLYAKVRRMGDLSKSLVCTWRITYTNMRRATWKQFKHGHGYVEFAAGASEASVTLPMIRDDSWNREIVYQVQLAKPPSKAGGSGLPTVAFGRASRLSVCILNNEKFPSNVPADAPLIALVWGFLAHNYQEVPREAVWGICITLWVFVDVMVSSESGRVLLDCTVSPGDDCRFWGIPLENASANNWLPILIPAFISLALFIVNHWRKNTFRELRLGGKTTRKLRVNLFATILQLSFDKTQVFDKGDLIKIIDWHSDRAVKGLWLNAFKCLEVLMWLVAHCTILIVTSFAALIDGDWSVCVMCTVTVPTMILVVILSAWFTGDQLYEFHSQAAGYEKNLFTFVEMCGINQSLIHMLRQVEPTVACADSVHGAVNAAQIRSDDYSDRHRWRVKWCFLAMQLILLVIGGRSARVNYDSPGSGLSVGTFALVNSVVVAFGKALLQCTDLYMECVGGGSSLKEISTLLNLASLRRVHFEKQLTIADDYGEPFAGSADDAIVLQGVTYAYPAGFDGPGKLSIVDLSARFEFDHVCCIDPRSVAGSQVGINTLFRMLAGQLIPDRGTVSIPGKTRVVYLPQTPMLFDGTIMYNLLYCMLTEDPDTLRAAKEVAWMACKALGMSAYLIGQEDFDIGESGERMQYSDRVCCTIVRALLFDADVLLLSSLLDALGDDQALRVLACLRTYVTDRALPGSGALDLPWDMRPPKLVIYRTKIQALGEQGTSIACRQKVKPHATGSSSLNVSRFLLPSTSGMSRLPSLPRGAPKEGHRAKE